MWARIRSRTTIIALVSLVVLISGAPRARAGRCQGADRALVVRLFEHLSYLVENKISSWELHVTGLLAALEESTLRLTPILSMNMIRLEARWDMRSILTSQDFSPSKMHDGLQEYIDRAKLLLSSTGDFVDVPPKDVKSVVATTAGALAVCRAVRQKSPEVCASLEPADRGGMRSKCESIAIRVGILYRHDCSEEAVGIMASAFQAPPGVMMKFCFAVRDKKPLQCDSIPGIPPDGLAICRALAGRGKPACQNPVLSKKARQECLYDLLIQAAATGKTPLEAIPDELKEQDLLWPALLSLRSEKTCDELALDAYDEIIPLLNLFTHTF